MQARLVVDAAMPLAPRWLGNLIRGELIMQPLTGLRSRTNWLLLAGTFALCSFIVACGGQQPQSGAAPGAASGDEKRYQLKGTVVSADRSQNKLTINHEEIPGFMSAMTMPYPVIEPKLM